MKKVTFKNTKLDLNLVGNLYLPENLDETKKYPAVVVTGPMLSVKEQAQSIYAARLAEKGYIALVFDGAYYGESEGFPRSQELPEVKQMDIEAAVDFLESLPYVDSNRIAGLGMCGSGSYMSVAGVKEERLKTVAAIVPAISDISASPMTNFFMLEDEVKKAKEAYESGTGKLVHLDFMPRAFEEGAAYYYTARGNRRGWTNKVVAWSQLDLQTYNVPNIMKNMTKPYLAITGENAWSRPATQEVFDAIPTENKKLHVIAEASHFDLYDLYPYVDEAVEVIVEFFGENL
ncbi:alpha/beta hydrolase [Gemella cuniculi]|uniref:alpha/beta hydrolase n=1 Tax=Gemella cuniculi TaxID=150240 RepID=UPI000404D535|nr:alpha/beta hydrolase [Gemella cuniculi]